MRVIALLLCLTACTPEVQTVYVNQSLHRPARPVLPRVSAEQLQCLDNASYQTLYDRQRLITDYAVELEAIIDSTQAEVKGGR